MRWGSAWCPEHSQASDRHHPHVCEASPQVVATECGGHIGPNPPYPPIPLKPKTMKPSDGLEPLTPS